MAIPEDVRGLDAAQSQFLLKYLELRKQNIQHNEQTRDRLFNLYLVITGAFLIALKLPNLPLDLSILPLSILLWMIGVLFIGAFVKYRAMITRDFEMALVIERLLLQQHGVTELETIGSKYWARFDGGWRQNLSVSSVVTLTTVLLSSASLSVGIWAAFTSDARWLPLVLVLSVAGNSLILLGVPNWVFRVRPGVP